MSGIRWLAAQWLNGQVRLPILQTNYIACVIQGALVRLTKHVQTGLVVSSPALRTTGGEKRPCSMSLASMDLLTVSTTTRSRSTIPTQTPLRAIHSFRSARPYKLHLPLRLSVSPSAPGSDAYLMSEGRKSEVSGNAKSHFLSAMARVSSTGPLAFTITKGGIGYSCPQSLS